jgi:hypothetical protein
MHRVNRTSELKRAKAPLVLQKGWHKLAAGRRCVLWAFRHYEEWAIEWAILVPQGRGQPDGPVADPTGGGAGRLLGEDCRYWYSGDSQGVTPLSGISCTGVYVQAFPGWLHLTVTLRRLELKQKVLFQSPIHN